MCSYFVVVATRPVRLGRKMLSLEFWLLFFQKRRPEMCSLLGTCDGFTTCIVELLTFFVVVSGLGLALWPD